MAEQQPSHGPASPGAGDLSDEDEAKAAIIANRFDIRRIIGGLFLLYGAVLVVTGIVGTSAIKHKAAGINVDLWTGLGMLVFGVFMIVWALQRPVMPDPPERRGRGSGRLRRAPS
ncbi:MAG: rane protein [Solirubrobacterales bacterium]|jgi:hypothetical protein|nr:rane protein [Solirubrobacterales bacterium]